MLKKFLWEAINNNGYRVKGTYYTNNSAEVTKMLLQQKFTPLKIKEIKQLWLFISTKNISYEHITEFLSEITTLITAEISFATALYILEKNIKNKRLLSIVQSIQKSIAGGQSISEAFNLHTTYFDATTCNLIHAGEQSGTLDIILLQICKYREKISMLQRNIKKALLYPAIVLIIAGLVTVAILIFVIPQFTQLFANVGAELPPFTKSIIAIANFIKNKGIVYSVIIFTVIALLKIAYKKYFAVRAKADILLLNLPVIGKIIQQAILARCFHTVAIMLHAGLPLYNSLKLTTTLTGNNVYKASILNISQKILGGQTLHESMQSEFLFSDRIVQMISIGEESGCLEEMLNKLSLYHSTQLDNSIHYLNQFLEPFIMIFLCIIVGSIVIAVYLPIFHLGAVI